MISTINCGTTHMREGDEFTIAGHGYDRKGRLINNGRFVLTGKKTRAKIVKLKVFKVTKVYSDRMDIHPLLITR